MGSVEYDTAEEALAQAVGGKLDLDVDALDDQQLHELVVGSHRAAARLAAVRAKLIAAWDARGVWGSNGARTPAVRLGNDCKISSESAAVELRRARKLRSMPHTLAALAAGEISVDHVDLLGRANYGTRQTCFAESEEMLVGHCRRLRFPEAEHVVAYCQQHEPTTDRCTCAPCSTRSVGRSSSPNSPAWNDSCTTPNSPPANSSARRGSDEPTPW